MILFKKNFPTYSEGGISPMKQVFMIIELILGIAMIVVIYMQPSKSDALSGFIQGGGKDTFFSKNKAKTKEVMLVRLTAVIAALFAINTFIVNMVK